jgi:Asp-tRNA(Asn)/Glu-tRNA(Gln) amidotransferase A subunit family amidase
MVYDLKPMKAPRAAGRMLRALALVIESPGAGTILCDKLLADAGIAALRDRPTHQPPDARHPIFEHGEAPASPNAPPADLELLLARLPPVPASTGFRPETIADFAVAYREKRATPLAIAEQALAATRKSNEHEPPMRAVIAQREDDVMAQARASAERFARGAPLGPLDGVPVVVKDELDQTPYPTTVGTRFLGREPARVDAEVVARLRRAGALLIGKGNMHEMGLGVTGVNPHHGAARNPYDPQRATGGSSSGPAAAVGLGLCPLAVGADGGGSIRIPAALCGQVGLKPTFGRVSEHGAAELCWSVAHVGPIAATVRDCALGYALMAGPDAKDEGSLLQPAPVFDDIGHLDLAGVRIGVFRAWFEDAEPAVVAGARRAVGWLEEAGARVVDISIPELETLRVAHLVTIVAEMTAAHLAHYREHRDAYAADTRVNLALGRRLQGYDYVHAQRHRARVLRLWREAMRGVDAVATPTAGRTAPLIPDDALETGESNLEVVGQIIRFAAPANLTGLPAISVPVGYDDGGLPIGLQLIGHGWQEHVLLRLAAVVEQRAPRRPPRVHHRYLG